MDPLQGLDRGAAYWIGEQRKRGIAAVDACFSGIASLGHELVLGIIAVMIIVWLLRYRSRLAAEVFLASILVAIAAIRGLQVLVYRSPPAADERIGNISPSFPSESAFLSSLVYIVLALILSGNRPLRRQLLIYGVCAVVIMMIGASHLYFGDHFLTDMLAGWAGGTMLALAGDRIAGYSRPKGGISPGVGAPSPRKIESGAL